MKQHDIIIIGAGISGLSLAHYCAKEGLDTAVFEKGEKPGGCFCSHRFGGDSGFWLELGAHTCYNSYGNLIGIIEDCDILNRIVKREKVGFKLLVDGELKSIPSQIGFLELLLSVRRIFSMKRDGESVESYYSKIVGSRNYERVFGPAFNAVISQRANDFPADMLFKKRPRRKDVLKSFTFKEGLQTITDSIASERNISLTTGVEIREASFDGDLFSVSDSEGNDYESRLLCLAVTPDAAAGILRTSFPDLSRVLSDIGVEAIETVGVAVRKSALSVPPVAGIIAVKDFFYSAVSRDTVPNDSYRGFSFHFKKGSLGRDSKIRRISEVLKIQSGSIEHVVEKENILPSLKVNHHTLVGRMDSLLRGKRLFLTGNYFFGLAIEDCVSRSLSEFTRLKEML